MSTFLKVKKCVADFFSDIRIYRGGIILFGDSSYKVKGDDVRNIINIVEPGDVLLRRYDHYLGSIIIPGYYSHSALYLGNDTIIHMLGDGIKKEDILTFLRCDAISVLRCKDKSLSESAMIKAVELYNAGVKYDYDFNFSDSKYMSCTEYIDYCFGGLFNGKKIIIPDDFLDSIFDVVLTTKR
jgi:hypothetical protein